MGRDKQPAEASFRENAANNRRISDMLKAYYSSIEEQEIPDVFLDLLERLDAAEQQAATAVKGNAP